MTLSAYIINLKQQFSTDTVILSKIIVIPQKDVYISFLFNKCEKRGCCRALEDSTLYAKISFFEQISSKAHILSITFGSAINPAKTFF